METIWIKTEALEQNTGQVPGLPANPRQWTQTDIDRIARSLEETPELFEARPIVVFPFDGKYVILGGNLRYAGSRQNGYDTVPCVALPEDTPVDKLKEVVIKDNAAIGDWDWDLLANEWSDYPLADYGIPVPYREEDAHKDAPAAPVDDRVVIEVKLSTDEFDFAIRTLRKYGSTPEEAVLKLFGHEG